MVVIRTGLDTVPIVVAAFSDGASFLDSLRRGDGGSDLAIPTRAAPPPGTPVVVEIGWTDLPERVAVRAETRRRWFGDKLNVKIEAADVAKVDFLVGVAEGRVNDVRVRRHQRFHVRLPVRWRRFGDTGLIEGVAEDVSAGGMLLSTPVAPVEAGDQVAVRMQNPDAKLDLVVTGDVKHVDRREGEPMQLGIEFEYRASGEHRALRRLLRQFAACGVVAVGRVPTA